MSWQNGLLLFLLVGAFPLGCGKKSDDNDKVDPVLGKDVPVGELSGYDLATIQTFVKEEAYAKWTAEPKVHKATANSPHGPLRVFFNDTITEALKAGKTVMPKGSIVVKEIYESDLKTKRGYALDAKIKDGSGGDTWVFFEGFAPEYDDAHGVNVPGCTGCHAPGTDFLRTSLP